MTTAIGNQEVSSIDNAAREALENGWAFSCIENRQVRYWGKDSVFIRHLIAQMRYLNSRNNN